MIHVTRINNVKLVINADLIELVEAIPETMITLTTGKKIMVMESVDEIISRVAGFKRISVPGFEQPGTGAVTGESHGA